jgi:hypothetical protein
MGAAAREWAMSTFSWDTIAARLEAVYLDALRAPARGAAAPLRQGYGGRA